MRVRVINVYVEVSISKIFSQSIVLIFDECLRWIDFEGHAEHVLVVKRTHSLSLHISCAQ